MHGLERSGSKREGYLILGICILAFMVRVIFSFVIFPQLAGPVDLGRAPDKFDELAINLVEGRGFTYSGEIEPQTFKGPGYPFLLAAVYAIFGSLVPAAVVVQCLIGSLLCFVMYLIAKQVFDTRLGIAAALIAALHPFLIWYSPQLRYEPLLALLLAYAIYWMLRAQDSGKLKDAFFMGLLIGYAALVNQVAILLPAVLFLGLLLLKSDKTAQVKQFAVVMLTVVAIIIPWTVRNYQVSGLIIPVHSGGVTQFMKGNYEFEHYREAPMQTQVIDHMGVAYVAQLLGRDPALLYLRETGIDQALMPSFLSFWRTEPWKLLPKIITQVPRFWYLSASPLKSRVLASIQVALLLPALVGAVQLLRTRRYRLLLPILLPIAYFNLVYAATHVEARYSLPIVPLVIILAAFGMQILFGLVSNGRLRRARRGSAFSLG